MYEQRKKVFADFIKPREIGEEIGCSILFFVLSLMGLLPDISIAVFFVLAGIGIVMIAFVARSMSKHDQYIQSLERAGYMPKVLQDFAQSTSVLKGELRFGHKYLYAKGCGKVLSYTEITRVYQYIHKTNFVEDRRELRYVDRNGRVSTLCMLQKRGKADAELRGVLMLMLRKNPNMQIGYNK